MKKILSFFFLTASIFLMNAEDIKSPIMEGTIGGKPAVLQIVFHTEIDQDMESSVQGWFYYKADGENNKYVLSGAYGGNATEADILFYVGKKYDDAITDEGEMKGDYNSGYMSGVGETGTFEGTFESHDGKKYTFSFSNI